MASEIALGTSPERELVIAMQRASELARTVAGAVTDTVSRAGVLDGGLLDDARAAASELFGALGMASEITGELRAVLPTVVDRDLVDALDGDLDDAIALARDTARTGPRHGQRVRPAQGGRVRPRAEPRPRPRARRRARAARGLNRTHLHETLS
jgi:hypothetical protein